jgi:phage shock protein C
MASMNTNKRLYRSDDPVFAGVCGGLAEYFELDPTLIRILTVILVLAGFGLPVIAYIIAMVVMPRRSDEYPGYIDVKPAPAPPTCCAPGASGNASATPGTTGTSEYPGNMGAAPAQATAQAASGGMGAPPVGAPPVGAPPVGAPPAQAAAQAAAQTAPGCAYTACNPQAYDAAGPWEQGAPKPSTPHRLHAGIMLGILLVGIGLLALLDTFLNMAAWDFWPLIIIAFGFMFLCTPGKTGWSLVRAGHGLSLLAIGFTLQLWTLDIIETRAFALAFLYLWPILLIMLGLFIIGGATNNSVFRLFGSLLFSLALLFGIWNFGQVTEPLNIELPGGYHLQVPVPPPSFIPSESDSIIQGDVWLLD